ncbi:MAG: glycosyltransferase family 2 protein [Longimicrobiales bacterium]
MPCYNEQESVGITVRRLVTVFAAAGHDLELITVDNGSSDRTGEILSRLAREYPSVRPHRIDVNRGYGNGLLAGIPHARGKWIGFIPADGQIDAEDVVRLYECAVDTDGNVVAKARRRFRMDGLQRKFVSIGYNVMIRMLWPRLDSLDINGTPKILPRQALLAMQLESQGWFLDPEIMLKAHAMGMRVLEFNVFARMRGSGVSHVRASTCWEFFRNLLVFRFGSPLRDWKRSLGRGARPYALPVSSLRPNERPHASARMAVTTEPHGHTDGM